MGQNRAFLPKNNRLIQLVRPLYTRPTTHSLKKKAGCSWMFDDLKDIDELVYNENVCSLQLNLMVFGCCNRIGFG